MDQKKTTLEIWRTARGTHWKIVLLLLMRAAIALVSVVVALVLRDLINAAIAQQHAEFVSQASLFILLIGIRVAAGAANRYLQESVSAELENKWKSRLLSTLLRKDYGHVSAVHSGEWMTRLTNDTVVVASGMTNLLPDLAAMFVRLIGATAAIVLMEPRFLYLLVPGAAALIALSYLSRKRMKALHKLVQEKDGALRTCLQENFSGMLVVRSYGVEQLALQQAAEQMANHQAARLHRNRFSNLCNTGFSALMNATYVAGACYCGYGILTGTISYGTFTAILQLIGQLQNPLANLSGILPRYYAMISSAERLLEAETLDEAVSDHRKSLEEVLDIYEKQLKRIVLEDISFFYLRPGCGLGKAAAQKETIPALSGWNFSIQKGDNVAITGSSGSGKSTLLKLLMCLYTPDHGRRYLQLDGQQLPLDGCWQRLFAYVPQGNYLMQGTIRDMVAFSDETRRQDSNAIWEALTVACADGFVRSLEHGLDTELGERGAGLSEGQMQRLAIARAIFSRSPILILDECSSALDEATEAQLLCNLRAMTDRTVLIITHRPAALQICDVIWHVDDGITCSQGVAYEK